MGGAEDAARAMAVRRQAGRRESLSAGEPDEIGRALAWLRGVSRDDAVSRAGESPQALRVQRGDDRRESRFLRYPGRPVRWRRFARSLARGDAPDSASR